MVKPARRGRGTCYRINNHRIGRQRRETLTNGESGDQGDVDKEDGSPKLDGQKSERVRSERDGKVTVLMYAFPLWGMFENAKGLGER